MKELRFIIFKNGRVMTTKLSSVEVNTRLIRLDNLKWLVESYEEGTGLDIYNRVVAAYNKNDNFTGIIRLSRSEKDFLSNILHNGMLDDDVAMETLMYYVKED